MATAQATVTITVDGTAAAVDDSLPDVTAGTVVNFVFANLVVNDRVNGVPVVIGENATFTLGALTNPASGTLVDNGDGTGTFTPAAGYCGPVSFSYTIENICASDDPCPSADYAISVVCTQVNDFGSGNAAALAAAFPEFEWGVTPSFIMEALDGEQFEFVWGGGVYQTTSEDVPHDAQILMIHVNEATACFNYSWDCA